MDFIFRAAENFFKKHKRLARYRRVFAFLAAVVVFATTYELILPAITMDQRFAAGSPGVYVGKAQEEGTESADAVDEEALQAAEQAQKEAEEAAKKAEEEKARKEAEEAAKKAEEEKARKEAEEAAKKAEEEKARKEAEEAAKKAEEEKARKEAEEAAKKAEEEKAQKEAEEAAKKAEEEQAQKESEEAAEKAAKEQAQKEAEEKAQKEAAEEQAQKETDEAAEKTAESKKSAESKESGKDDTTVDVPESEVPLSEPDQAAENSDAGKNTGSDSGQESSNTANSADDTHNTENAGTDGSNSAGDASSNSAEADDTGSGTAATDETGAEAGAENGLTTDPADPALDPAAADTGLTAAPALEEPAIEYPVTLVFEGEDYTVTAVFDEDAALPANVTLTAAEILPDYIYHDGKGSPLYAPYDEYYENSLTALEEKDLLEETKITSARFFDISFRDEQGANVEPAAPVEITVSYKDALQADETDDVHIVHFDETTVTKKMKSKEEAEEFSGQYGYAFDTKKGDTVIQPVIEDTKVLSADTEIKKEEVKEIDFKADAFSVYAIVAIQKTDKSGNETTLDITSSETVTVTGSTDKSAKTHEWASKDEDVVTVSADSDDQTKATLQATGTGKTTVTHTYKNKKERVLGTDIFTVTVEEETTPEPPADVETSLSADPDSVTLAAGSRTTVSVTLSEGISSVIVESEDESIATAVYTAGNVSASGNDSTSGNGSATKAADSGEAAAAEDADAVDAVNADNGNADNGSAGNSNGTEAANASGEATDAANKEAVDAANADAADGEAAAADEAVNADNGNADNDNIDNGNADNDAQAADAVNAAAVADTVNADNGNADNDNIDNGNADNNNEVNGVEAVSGDENVTKAADNSGDSVETQGTITIIGVAEGETTITISGTAAEGYSAPETKTITVTVTAQETQEEQEEQEDPLTDEDSTAENTESSVPSGSGMTVTVKETGNLKKLRNYHVVVEDADTEYEESEENFLKAYHIYLADNNEAEVPVEDIEGDSTNNGNSENSNSLTNLNLQVTITYDTAPDWFEAAASAKNIRHFKTGGGNEQEIKNIKFDAVKKSISFIVHGFSDFVIKSGSTATTGEGTQVTTQEGSILDGMTINDANEWQIVRGEYENNEVANKTTSTNGKVRVQKNVIPTDTENEFLMYLSVDINRDSILQEYFENVGIVYTPSNQGKGYGDYWTSGHCDQADQAVSSGNDNGSMRLFSKVKTSTTSYKWTLNITAGGKIYTITRYATSGSFNKGHVCMRLPSGWITVGDAAKTNGNVYDFTIEDSALQVILSDVTNVNIGTVVDTMGTGITATEIASYKPTNTSTTTGNSATISSDGKTITWNMVASTMGYTSDGWYPNIAELVYKITYDPTVSNGLDSGTTNVASYDTAQVATNSSAELTYKVTTSSGSIEAKQAFESPVIRGMLYEIKGLKVSKKDNTLKLGNAVFSLYADEDCTNQIGISTTAENVGEFDFTNLQWGTYYLKETTAPEGYKGTTDVIPVTVCYTTNASDLTGQGVGEEALYKTVSQMTIENEPYELTVTKVWDDKDNESDKRPSSVTVHLMQKEDTSASSSGDSTDSGSGTDAASESANAATQDGTQYGENVTLNEGNNWTYTWTALPTEDGDGNSLSYYIVEDAVDGYTTSILPAKVTASDLTSAEEGKDPEITVTNTLISYREVALLKVDSGNAQKVLDGAEFELYVDAAHTQNATDFEGNEIGTIITGSSSGDASGDEQSSGDESGDEQGTGETQQATGMATIGKLLPGTYYLYEKKAPSGYNSLAQDVIIYVEATGVRYYQASNSASAGSGSVSGEGESVEATSETSSDDDTLIYTITVTNSTGVELPKTGGEGLEFFMRAGLVLMIGSAIYFMLREKQMGRW